MACHVRDAVLNGKRIGRIANICTQRTWQAMSLQNTGKILHDYLIRRKPSPLRPHSVTQSSTRSPHFRSCVASRLLIRLLCKPPLRSWAFSSATLRRNSGKRNRAAPSSSLDETYPRAVYSALLPTHVKLYEFTPPRFSSHTTTLVADDDGARIVCGADAADIFALRL